MLSMTIGAPRAGAAVAVVLAVAVMVGAAGDTLAGRGPAPARQDDAGTWCFPEIEGDCPEPKPGLPSRVSLNHADLRSFRHHRRDPFSPSTVDAPRLAVLLRLADEGRRPLLARWRRGMRLSTDGLPYTGARDRFEDVTAPLTRPVRLLPVWTPDAHRWGEVQEAILATASDCPCLQAASPGQTPDGNLVPGTPLLVAKNSVDPADLDLRWERSCLDAVDDYSIHEGYIGSWYSHAPHTCTTGGSTGYTLTPGTRSYYYVIVPLNADAEGSYGTDSGGTQRPTSTTNCRSKVKVDPCP